MGDPPGDAAGHAVTLSGRVLDRGLAVLVAAQLGASLWLSPAGDQVTLPGGASLGPLCWFRAVTDVDCPFCGLTRSFVALAHGDLAAAVRFHPAGPLLFAAMVAALIALGVVWMRGTRPLAERRGFLIASEAVAVMSVMLGVVKMVRS
ncbi:MAG: DUF2752 domain-containing protein [Myxococcales bacterium]|nr:DUF2752 domain-containing protein [Myxococcales bacterium]